MQRMAFVRFFRTFKIFGIIFRYKTTLAERYSNNFRLKIKSKALESVQLGKKPAYQFRDLLEMINTDLTMIDMILELDVLLI